MSKLQGLVKKYGKVAIAVHLGVYAATLAGAYKSQDVCALAVLDTLKIMMNALSPR